MNKYLKVTKNYHITVVMFLNEIFTPILLDL